MRKQGGEKRNTSLRALLNRLEELNNKKNNNICPIPTYICVSMCTEEWMLRVNKRNVWRDLIPYWRAYHCLETVHGVKVCSLGRGTWHLSYHVIVFVFFRRFTDEKENRLLKSLIRCSITCWSTRDKSLLLLLIRNKIDEIRRTSKWRTNAFSRTFLCSDVKYNQPFDYHRHTYSVRCISCFSSSSSLLLSFVHLTITKVIECLTDSSWPSGFDQRGFFLRPYAHSLLTLSPRSQTIVNRQNTCIVWCSIDSFTWVYAHSFIRNESNTRADRYVLIMFR